VVSENREDGDRVHQTACRPEEIQSPLFRDVAPAHQVTVVEDESRLLRQHSVSDPLVIHRAVLVITVGRKSERRAIGHSRGEGVDVA